jgi:hypothetical protein
MNITQFFSCCKKEPNSIEEIQRKRMKMLPFYWKYSDKRKVSVEELHDSSKTYCELSKKITEKKK